MLAAETIPLEGVDMAEGSYHSRRFDGDKVYPQFDINLWQYIQLHQISILVTNANRADSCLFRYFPSIPHS